MPREITVKTILNKHKRRDSWFLDDYSINLYSGCSFNCLFCYIRGSKFGTHMERTTAIKMNALEILDRQLYHRSKKGHYGFIVVSSATDPYLKIEKETQLTRQALELILKHRFPIHVITRSSLVERDFDLIQKIDVSARLPNNLKQKMNRGAVVTFSFSTLDDAIARIFEPGATAPSLRIESLSASLQFGLMSGVSMMPMYPYISDTTASLEHMMKTFQALQVNYVYPATLTLFGEGPADSKTLMLKAVRKHYPELVEKYKRFFSRNTEMPAYYRKAFDMKMKELLLKYQLPGHILESQHRYQ